MIEINVKGFTAIIDWAYNYFRQHAPGQIAAITSVAGIRGNAVSPAYFAAKAYQIHYLQSLRHKAKKEKPSLTITDIRPGFVQTKNIDQKLFWSAAVNKAAWQIYLAIKNKTRVAYITHRWKIIGMLLPLLPGWLYEKI